jgi:NADH:ubiquinone oxidoreductase subunit 6 (subunit J)
MVKLSLTAHYGEAEGNYYVPTHLSSFNVLMALTTKSTIFWNNAIQNARSSITSQSNKQSFVGHLLLHSYLLG